MENVHASTCVNCGSSCEGQFCSVCGQKLGVRRITFRTLTHEVAEKFLGLDNMFVRTVLHGFTKPGQVAMAYIRGNRRRYIGPAAYFVLITTLYLLYVNVSDFDYVAYAMSTFGETGTLSNIPEETDISIGISLKLMKHTRAIYALNALLLALPLWLFFRKEGNINLLESLAAATYISAQTILLALISVIVFSLTGYNSNIAISVLSIGLAGWLAATMFSPKPSLPNFIKGIVAVVISGIIAIVFIIAAMVVGILLFEEQFLRWLGMEALLEM